jgi:hypothetical protein
VCFCIHWVMQNTRQHFWLIHANSVDTVCVLFNSSFPCSRVCKSSTSCFLDKFLHTAPKVNLTKLTLHFTLCLCFSMSLVKSLSHTVDLLQQDFASVQSHTCINTWLPVPFACAERRTSGASQIRVVWRHSGHAASVHPDVYHHSYGVDAGRRVPAPAAPTYGLYQLI